ncbi:hypothetical protein HK405_009370, partial [Cladochytrium tenue]
MVPNDQPFHLQPNIVSLGDRVARNKPPRSRLGNDAPARPCALEPLGASVRSRAVRAARWRPAASA